MAAAVLTSLIWGRQNSFSDAGGAIRQNWRGSPTVGRGIGTWPCQGKAKAQPRQRQGNGKATRAAETIALTHLPAISVCAYVRCFHTRQAEKWLASRGLGMCCSKRLRLCSCFVPNVRARPNRTVRIRSKVSVLVGAWFAHAQSKRFMLNVRQLPFFSCAMNVRGHWNATPARTGRVGQ